MKISHGNLIRGTFCEKTITPKARLAAKSFRWKQSGKTWLLIACPRGKWRKGRCTVGTKVHKMLLRKRTCPNGQMIKKG